MLVLHACDVTVWLVISVSKAFYTAAKSALGIHKLSLDFGMKLFKQMSCVVNIFVHFNFFYFWVCCSLFSKYET